MKNPVYKKHLFLFVFTAILSAAVPISAQSTGFSYQGRLNSGGNPASGTYEMQFRLFDAVKGGAQIGATFTDANVAVVNGVFTTNLDFGASSFDGSPRFLETGVRPAGSPDPFTMLAPRQAINSTPYAIQAKNASQLGGTDANQYLQTSGSGAGLTGVVKSVNTLTNDVTLAEGNNITITPSGNILTIASTSGGVGGSGTTNRIPFWNSGSVLGDSLISQLGGTVLLPSAVSLAATASGNNITFGSPNSGTGMTIAGPTTRADVRLDSTTLRLAVGPAGGPPGNGIGIDSTSVQLPNNVLLALGAQGNQTQFGSPNGETGMTISGASGRADLRYDGTLKLLNGPGGIPPATNGIAIDTSGNVGIGTTTPIAKLDVENAQSGKSAVFGRETGTNGVGTYGEATAPTGVGVFARNLNGVALYADGNAAQARDKGGLLKAMALIHVYHSGFNNGMSTANVVRCYNSITNSSSGNCGISFAAVYYTAGVDINFGFQIDDRFISITGNSQSGGGAAVTSYPNSNTVGVLDGGGTVEFFIFIY